jgi:DtxR family Mn-dependent transcriptional regulator
VVVILVRTKTIEEYLEIIYILERDEGRARPGRIASALGVRPASITEMLKKLESEGFITYRSRRGACLTLSGWDIVQYLSRRHSVIAAFLRSIGVSEGGAEKDACQIEHHISEETIQQIELFLSSHRTPEKREDLERRGGGKGEPDCVDTSIFIPI